MGNLFASLDAAAGALRAFREGITVSQNNVQNASTPGYAKQNLRLEALPFQLETGSIGGVRTAGTSNSRSSFAERAVRQQLSSLGSFTQQASRLTQIESVFAVGGESGIPAAIGQLFNSFAEFSLSPDSPTARQSVLDAAEAVAKEFNQAAEQLSRLTSDIDTDLRETVEKINQTAAQIQQYNRRILNGSPPDAGLEATAFADAESLAELANVDILFQADGTMTVLLGGQVPVVIGDRFQPIAVESFTPAAPVNPGATPSVRIVDTEGRDITGMITQGELGGLLRIRSQVLPALSGDAMQEGSLNTMARHLADRVNAILTSGQVSAGPPAVPGIELFSYNTANGADVARTMALNPAISQDLLAAISPGPPYVSNGTALELSELRNSRAPQDTINGMTFVEFYSSMARQVGDQLSSARQEEARSNALVTQARDLRTQLSGVSLDEEAVQLVQFQRAYEANAQVAKVVDEMIQSVLGMLR
jgi:flagellar hook-associated protein 1 FlgK